MSYKWRCTGEGEKTQALASTTFAERLKPLFVYHFHKCIVNYHTVVQGCGCVCGIGGGGDGSVSDCWGRM